MHHAEDNCCPGKGVHSVQIVETGSSYQPLKQVKNKQSCGLTPTSNTYATQEREIQNGFQVKALKFFIQVFSAWKLKLVSSLAGLGSTTVLCCPCTAFVGAIEQQSSR